MGRFDLPKAKNAVNAYGRSIKVSTRIIDLDSTTLYFFSPGLDKGSSFSPDKSDVDACAKCKKMQEESDISIECEKYMLYGSYQAERFGGKYIYSCPAGFTFWTSPVISEEMMTGAIICGPVLMVNSKDFMIDDMLEKQGIKPKIIEKYSEDLYKMKITAPEIINDYSELLYIVAEHISVSKRFKHSEERELYESQGDIVKYIYHIKSMGGDTHAGESYPIQKEKELLSLISLGCGGEAKELLNEILGHIFISAGGNLEIIKARVLELVILLSRAALEGGADVEQIFGLNFNYLRQIHDFKTQEELNLWLIRIMSRFTDLVFDLKDVKHVDVIMRAVEYIKQNYMKKITLEDVAKYTYLSPSYFSKVFKEEMKQNFNSYLNQVRVEMSKKLLLNEDNSLVDVAIAIGYEDQSYFTKVFKKITGVSPGKYKESRGKVKQL